MCKGGARITPTKQFWFQQCVLTQVANHRSEWESQKIAVLSHWW